MSGPSLVGWAYLNGVELDFTWPGKPTDNTVMEAFNARFRGNADTTTENAPTAPGAGYSAHIRPDGHSQQWD